MRSLLVEGAVSEDEHSQKQDQGADSSDKPKVKHLVVGIKPYAVDVDIAIILGAMAEKHIPPAFLIENGVPDLGSTAQGGVFPE